MLSFRRRPISAERSRAPHRGHSPRLREPSVAPAPDVARGRGRDDASGPPPTPRFPSPDPLLDRGLDAAEPHIRSPPAAAGTKIPHARRRRVRKGGTNLYRGISHRGRYAVRPPGSAGIDRLPRRWLELDGLARRSGRL